LSGIHPFGGKGDRASAIDGIANSRKRLLTNKLLMTGNFGLERRWRPTCLKRVRKSSDLARNQVLQEAAGTGSNNGPIDFQISPYLRGDGEAMISINTPNSDVLLPPAPEARWYAAYTAPCRERRVVDHLAVREIESFLPLYLSSRKWKNGCRVELERPLFPGYVFVRVGRMDRVRVLEVPSVLSIVSRGCVPEPLDDDSITALRASLHLRKDVEPHPYLIVGERVSIFAGPFAGLSGIILRKQSGLRVVITLDLIMQSVVIEVDIEDVEPFRGILPVAKNALMPNIPRSEP
jgi:transcription termination/antitermination protein NusG